MSLRVFVLLGVVLAVLFVAAVVAVFLLNRHDRNQAQQLMAQPGTYPDPSAPPTAWTPGTAYPPDTPRT